MKSSKHQTSSSKEAQRNKLQRIALLASGVLFVAPGSWTAFGAQTNDNTPGRTDYRNFEIIPKRNIFSPRRSPGNVAPEPRQKNRPRTDTLALVGVMSYGKGPMAFFDGSRSDYRKVLKPNESIAGFKVTAIDASSVKLAASTNEIELQLGMQLAREEEGEWKLSMRPESLEKTYASGTPMRSAAQVNADRQSEADQNADPFANAFGNFLGNRGNGFPFQGGGNGFTGVPNQTTPAAQDTQTQPAVTAPANAGDILARLAARRAQETGDPQQQDPATGPAPDQGGPPNPRGRSPSPQNQAVPPVTDGQPPINQPGQQQQPQPNQQPLRQPGQQQPDQSGQQPSDQTSQPLLDQSGQPILDQSGQPILIQPGQQQPNQ
jgi:hypothetical protein